MAEKSKSQRGSSLIEVLIALLLVSLIISALAAGLLTFMRVNASTSQHQQLTHAIGNSSESIKAAPYRLCSTAAGGQATPAQYDSAYQTWPFRWDPLPDMVVSITKVEFWDTTTRTFTADPAIGCQHGDPGAQRLTIRVTWQGKDRFGQVVKRVAT